MNNRKLQVWVILLCLSAIILAGCGGAAGNSPTSTTLPGGATAPAFTGPLPAGDWTAATDFGNFVFTVDAGGKKISKLTLQFADKWVCGTAPTTDRPMRYVTTISNWPITDGSISILDNLDAVHKISLQLSGSYNEDSQILSGTWEENSNGTKCMGVWKAISPK
jgi:hypothetical protein